MTRLLPVPAAPLEIRVLVVQEEAFLARLLALIDERITAALNQVRSAPTRGEPDGNAYLRIPEAAKVMNYSARTVDRLIRAGLLIACGPPGRGRRVKRSEVDRYMVESATPHAASAAPPTDEDRALAESQALMDAAAARRAAKSKETPTPRTSRRR